MTVPSGGSPEKIVEKVAQAIRRDGWAVKGPPDDEDRKHAQAALGPLTVPDLLALVAGRPEVEREEIVIRMASQFAVSQASGLNAMQTARETVAALLSGGDGDA